MTLLSRIDAWLTDPAAHTQDQTADLLIACMEALEGKPRKPRAAPEAMRALRVIKNRPGIHISALGRALGVPESTVSNTVRLLERRGLARTQLEPRTQGRPIRACYATESA